MYTVSAESFTDSGTDVTVDGISYDLYSHATVNNADVLIEQGITFI